MDSGLLLNPREKRLNRLPGSGNSLSGHDRIFCVKTIFCHAELPGVLLKY
jgi:hypothetical protein